MSIATKAHAEPTAPPGLIRAYYQLTKPGIVYSNAMTAAAGYLFASRLHIHWPALFGLMVGTATIIAASCVLNNYIDRNLDTHMARTKKRASVTGQISLTHAVIFASLLYIVGFAALVLTNGLTIIIAAIAVLSYVVAYGIAKRKSVHGTLVGTLPGAASLVAGYTAVTGRFDLAALGLLLIMTFWQMAHFYSIAIFRRDDYAAAGLPVRSVSKGVANTKHHIIGYVVLFALVSCLMPLVSHERFVYLVVMLGLSGYWLMAALRGLRATDDVKWARGTFGRSLIVLLAFCAILPLGVWLP